MKKLQRNGGVLLQALPRQANEANGYGNLLDRICYSKRAQYFEVSSSRTFVVGTVTTRYLRNLIIVISISSCDNYSQHEFNY